jgi:type IV pilus assembly protein PilQ
MKVKRLLTVGLMALFCASTATAASQLNSVQVTPTATTATVSLRTTGSFAHKEYKPEDHVLMVDLTDVTASAAVEPAVSLNSAVLKSYKVSRYTSASGSEVTRIVFTLGDQVTADVNDVSDGLQVLLVGAPVIADSKSPAVPLASPSAPLPAKSASPAVKPIQVGASNQAPLLSPSAAQTAPAQLANAARPPVVQAAPVRLAEQSAARPALSPVAATGAPVAIRSVSVRRGQGTLDVIIEGPSSAHPFLLKNPDRLVLDFNNAVVRPSVRSITVHTKDVEQVRVGRFSSEPPVTRIVIDLKGTRAFDVLPSEKQVIVRVKSEASEVTQSIKAAPAPVLASVVRPTLAADPGSADSSSQNSIGVNDALASATRIKDVAMPLSAGSLTLRDQQMSNTSARTGPAAIAPATLSSPEIKPAPEAAKPAPAASEQPIKPAPAPVLASVTSPAVAAIPVFAENDKRNIVGSNAAPGNTPEAKPAVVTVPAPSTKETKPEAAKPTPAASEQPIKPAPAPVLASVTSPAVAVVPVFAENDKRNIVGSNAAPANTAEAKPAVVTVPAASSKETKPEVAKPTPVASEQPIKPAPALATVAAVPVTADSSKQSALSANLSASASEVKSVPAPTPVIAPIVPAVVANAISAVDSSRQSTIDSSASATVVKDVAAPVAARIPLPSPAPEQNLRSGIAADRIANSPQQQQTEPAPLMARLEPPAPVQFSSNTAPSSTAASTPKYTGEPISVNFKDVDLKDFFRLIHEISGLNIVLDPNVRGTVTLVLDDVPWDQALDIVLKNNGLDRELQGKVLRIAATDTLRREAVDRRAQSEAIALAVDRQTISRYLSYAKAKDVVPIIKKFLTARGDVIADERTNALIISDIPSVLPNLDRLISQLDRKSQEVEIEVRVVSATRSFSRDLGFQLGFNWGNGVSSIGGSNPNGVTPTVTSGGTANNNNNVPLFSNFPATGATTGLSFANLTATYGIDAILTAAETHNLAKVLSRPRVVTQSNIKAEVKQGVKIPVYTASTANANSSVSYVDAVLRLSVTPQITADNTIFLMVDVENTQPSGEINSNYILTTQQATTQVLVTDGGTVVIGGVIQTTNSVSTTQTPVLGDIPWLGNLFKTRSVSTETDELIFFITPKIIQT